MKPKHALTANEGWYNSAANEWRILAENPWYIFVREVTIADIDHIPLGQFIRVVGSATTN